MENPRYYKDYFFYASTTSKLIQKSRYDGYCNFFHWSISLHKQFFSTCPFNQSKSSWAFPSLCAHPLCHRELIPAVSLKHWSIFSFVNKSVHIITFPRKKKIIGCFVWYICLYCPWKNFPVTKHTFPLLYNLDRAIGFHTRIKGKPGNQFCNIDKSFLLIIRLLEADLKVLVSYSKKTYLLLKLLGFSNTALLEVAN